MELKSKFIYAYDKEIKKRVLHIVRPPYAICLITDNKIKLTDEEINYINNYKV